LNFDAVAQAAPVIGAVSIRDMAAATDLGGPALMVLTGPEIRSGYFLDVDTRRSRLSAGGRLCTVFPRIGVRARGCRKLDDRGQFRRVLASIPWIPRTARPVLAVAVPATELVVATTIFILPVAGALAILGLLTAFSGVLLIERFAGRSPECGCFGASAPRPAGAPTAIRNLSLAGLAVLVVVERSSTDLPEALTGIGLALLTAMLVAAAVNLSPKAVT
jgi:hypothetical protein